MKKNERKMVKTKNNVSHSAAERMASENNNNSKNTPLPSALLENHTLPAEKPWNPCDFYYY